MGGRKQGAAYRDGHVGGATMESGVCGRLRFGADERMGAARAVQVVRDDDLSALRDGMTRRYQYSTC
jgi:hypothetical protein